MKKSILIILCLLFALWLLPQGIVAQDSLLQPAQDSLLQQAQDSLAAAPLIDEESGGVYQFLKDKFVEGNPYFMSLVALTLVVGLAFCIERLVYLRLASINYHKLINQIEEKLAASDYEGALALCRNTRGPVATICYQALLRRRQSAESIERSLTSVGNLQVADLEKGCSWITLCIAIAPSLGFLGTVIGMVMAFDQIEQAGDIGPTIVAGGIKVALITTIFGLIVALILQLFYNIVISRIDHLTQDMEDAAVLMVDLLEEQQQQK